MGTAAPTNHADIDCSPEAIERDARYGVDVAQGIADWIGNTKARLDGARVLEVGPGTSYCGVLGLLARGATSPVYVADRWLSGWRDEYHPALYRRVAEILRARGNEALATAYETVAWRGYEGLVREIPAAAEALPVQDGSFDMIFSNAVLEHLADHQAAINEFFRVTAPGGWNFHQVDYRDHRNFDRPLDHLLMSADEWRAISEAPVEPFCFGTQHRTADHVAMFERAGFEVFKVFPINYAKEDYADGVAAQIGMDPKAARVLCSLIISRRPR